MCNHRVVANGAPLDDRFTNLALEARKAGHTPTLIGYNDTAADPRGLDPADPRLRTFEGLLPGFEVELNMPEEPEAWIAWLRSEGYDVPHGSLEVYEPVGAPPTGRGVTFPPPVYRAEHSDTAYMINRSLDWLASRTQQPWFLHLSLLRPHPPWIAPQPYNAMYRPEDAPLPRRAPSEAEEGAQHPLMRHWLDHRTAESFTRQNIRNCDITELDQREAHATYLGLISEVDTQLGRILEFLEATGQTERTLIVFTTDHGEQLGNHRLFGKLGWFDSSFHIPLIIRDPRAPDSVNGTRVEQFTESIDIMPTILEWLGQDVPAQCDGASLAPWLTGKTPPDWRTAAHFAFGLHNPATREFEDTFGLAPEACGIETIRNTRYKYVHCGGLPPLLYDLQDDPDELINRADDPDYREIALVMARELVTWRMRQDDRALANMKIDSQGLHKA